jgi:hypothetical protein
MNRPSSASGDHFLSRFLPNFSPFFFGLQKNLAKLQNFDFLDIFNSFPIELPSLTLNITKKNFFLKIGQICYDHSLQRFLNTFQTKILKNRNVFDVKLSKFSVLYSVKEIKIDLHTYSLS